MLFHRHIAKLFDRPLYTHATTIGVSNKHNIEWFNTVTSYA